MELNGDRMFCHACGGVWLRLPDTDMTCQRCGSDFTEIIEIPPDTEAEPPPNTTPPSSSPHRTRPFQPRFNPWVDHDPWDHPYNEDDGDEHAGRGLNAPPSVSHRTYTAPGGNFTFSSTVYNGSGGGDFGGPRQRSPGEMGDLAGGPLIPIMRQFDSIFNGLSETYQQQSVRNPRRARMEQRAQPQPQHQDEFPDPEEGVPDEQHGYGPRLYPRDADRPQPMGLPFNTLGDILEMFQEDFGRQRGPTPGGGGARVMTGPNPMALLSALLNPDHQRHGDAVYTQEALDRVITQIFEQNAHGNAPPPASQGSIQNLPKKQVDQEMLGSEGKAECSICMDAVDLGTEVTVLPCKHWFHYGCIEVWLNQHNTCPHCRRPIDAQEGSRDNPVNISDSPERPSRRQSGQHSGQQPWAWSYSTGSSGGGGREQQRSSRASDGQPGGGGLTGWMRNRFGGGN